MNRYSTKFKAICPNNGDMIEYSLVIESSSMIQVEEITAFLHTFDDGYHETFADKLQDKFGGKQYLTAIHGTVLIETIR
jgi:hypothetical protein